MPDELAHLHEIQDAVENGRLKPPQGGTGGLKPNVIPFPTDSLTAERRAIARLLLRRSGATSNKAVAEALRMAACDVVERTPNDTLASLEKTE